MKSGKYFAGGLIKGTGGKAIKSFMKSDLYKNLKSDMLKKVNKMYNTPGIESNKKFLTGLKKLDVKNQKAEMIGKALSHVGDGTRKLPRNIQASLKRGARNIGKYQKKISETATAFMKRKLSKQRDN
mgnify:CR=1 FL=1